MASTVPEKPEIESKQGTISKKETSLPTERAATKPERTETVKKKSTPLPE
ncbi:MAG: hypothetical protein JNM88_13515 [Chitinophagaceae bacterium]|nr:hypothetical protein [Chitinophagaceae bacterium]